MQTQPAKPRPFQFTLLTLLLVALVASLGMSFIATVGRIAAAFPLLILVTADLCRRKSRRLRREGETSLAWAWLIAAILVALLAAVNIAIIVRLLTYY